jgi:N-methylhydantoinase A
MADTPRPALRAVKAGTSADPVPGGHRDIYWDELRRAEATPIYDGARLEADQWVYGPAVIETPDTSVVVRHGQALRLDRFGNFELILDAVVSPAARRATILEEA